MAEAVADRRGRDPRRGRRRAARSKSLFVVVVGETARADHFGLNGYARATTPELAKVADLINFPKAYSCGTDTAQSVPCMFSGLAATASQTTRPPARHNLLDILKRTGIDVVWRENQAGCKGVCDRVTTEVLTGLKHPTFYAYSENHDEILLDGLPERRSHWRHDTVIVMHMMGSHGPAYWKRYPAALRSLQAGLPRNPVQPLQQRGDRQRLRQYHPLHRYCARPAHFDFEGGRR